MFQLRIRSGKLGVDTLKSVRYDYNCKIGAILTSYRYQQTSRTMGKYHIFSESVSQDVGEWKVD